MINKYHLLCFILKTLQDGYHHLLSRNQNNWGSEWLNTCLKVNSQMVLEPDLHTEWNICSLLVGWTCDELGTPGWEGDWSNGSGSLCFMIMVYVSVDRPVSRGPAHVISYLQNNGFPCQRGDLSPIDLLRASYKSHLPISHLQTV